MSDEESYGTRVARRRSLMTTVVPEHLKNPMPEWEYRRSLRPAVIVRELWDARQIIRTITERNLRVRYKQSVLGFAWALLTPLALLVVLTFVFGRVAGVESSGVPYSLFAYLGLLPWTFFSSSVSSGSSSIISDKPLLSKSQFPREVFPLSSVAVAAVDAMLAMVALLVLFVIFGVVPSATTPLVILPLIVLVTLTTGVAVAMSVVVVHLRDLRVALPLILQVGLFATPVAYGLDHIPQSLRLVYCFLNPVAPVIDSIRRTVLLGQAPQWGYLGVGALMSVVVLTLGYMLFKKLEGGLIDVA